MLTDNQKLATEVRITTKLVLEYFKLTADCYFPFITGFGK